jgi:nicotinate-nucleotide adenylyltransferase
MRTTYVIGGSFIPPTIAHEEILSQILEIARQNNAEIWLMPSGNRRDKTISTPLGVRKKLIMAMIRDATGSDNSQYIRFVDIEMSRSEKIETYDTHMRLIRDYPDRHFVWVFGADSIETMLDWKSGEWLLQNLEMIIFERNGSQVNGLARRVSVRRLDRTVDVSSTRVRQMIADRADYSQLVGAHVARVIAQNKTHLANDKVCKVL